MNEFDTHIPILVKIGLFNFHALGCTAVSKYVNDDLFISAWTTKYNHKKKTQIPPLSPIWTMAQCCAIK